MSITTKKLKQAITQYREETTTCFEVEAIQAFTELYNMLGETELRDGIATAMQDAGYDEAYEEIMYNFDELDDMLGCEQPSDFIIEQSGE